MYVKEINYTDFNGVERTEKHYFNLTQADLMEMEMGTTGGFTTMINNIIDSKDAPALIKTFKELILKAYGEKSADGKYFKKFDDDGRPLSLKFSQTEAYSVLFMELATDSDAASSFVNGILPEIKSAETPATIAAKNN